MSIFNNLFKFENKKEIIGLNNETKALFVANYFKKEKQTVVLVTSTLYEANAFFQAILNYTDDVLLFPMDDFLTTEALAISPELKTVRLETLSILASNDKKIIVTDLMGYLRFLPTLKQYEENIISLKNNDSLKVDQLVEKLFDIGYTKENIVNKTGDMAVRGYVIDVFPINDSNPIRIEYWGDQIESIKYFDVNTQRTIENLKEIKILPNSEFITDKYAPFEERKQKNLYKYSQVTSISNFYKSAVFINNYDNIILSYKNLLEEILEYNTSMNISNQVKYMHDFYEIKNEHEYHFNQFDNITNSKSFSKYDVSELDFLGKTIEEVNISLNKLLKQSTIILCIKNKEKIREIAFDIDNSIITSEENIFENKINIINKKILAGFKYDKYIFVCEKELYNLSDKSYKYKTNFKIGTKINDISKLELGDYVVHSLYGIGKYCGIKTLEKNGLKKDYLFVQYKGTDKLYIPVEKIDYIHKYSSKDGAIPNLNKLNSKEWSNTKNKVKGHIEDIAKELLSLYAIREKTVGFAFAKDSSEQREFEDDFIYDETVDQIKVINEIKKDMESIHPMDRLLCGDVGYGKTEVAFRAVFKAILSNKQAALLCPTTILSNQHYQNALERFKNFPVRIALLNRFVTDTKAKEILDDLKNGRVDFLIGTHRLLSNDVIFKDLGLLVIDEEQRFGVKHKEIIKEYKNNIDVLTLSATPIPRTLQMSLTGVRGLSLIETPPVNRYPIQTYVLAYNKQLIKDAIYKELSRDGQVFILFNHIDNMQSKKEEINKLVPEARIVTANGRMNKESLEDVMEKFVNKEYDILLCTTIIETGIDIPNVNTLIIIDADYFGLSQLYQIRGRVGRSNKIAYSYLMYNKEKSLTEVAIKRLKAIKEFTELGSGFSIAMRDLSIRGAGNILGSEQAGFIDSIGIELFLEMLENEINKEKGIVTKEEEKLVPLVEVATSIDDKIVAEDDLKIEIHKKINSIDSLEGLNNVLKELEDRFGKINEDVITYMYEELFEKMANQIGIKNIKQNRNILEIEIPDLIFKKIKVTDLFIDVSNISRNFKFSMRGKHLIINLNTTNLDKHFIYYLIDLVTLLKKSN